MEKLNNFAKFLHRKVYPVAITKKNLILRKMNLVTYHFLSLFQVLHLNTPGENTSILIQQQKIRNHPSILEWTCSQFDKITIFQNIFRFTKK